ncbi:hypothetical protein N0V88_001515 [Collariella sp. IMI 366227]|nr:hypothetical protein N0V88_001515 [Collariella sp. IMI 366227]
MESELWTCAIQHTSWTSALLELVQAAGRKFGDPKRNSQDGDLDAVGDPKRNSQDGDLDAAPLNTKNSQIPEAAALDASIDTLLAQWQTCIEELQHFQQASAAASRPVRGINALLKVQQRALDKATQKHQASTASSAAAISSAQYYGIKSCCWDDRWAVVKKCRGLIAINKDFPRSPRLPVAANAGWLAFKDRPFQERPVAVDAVVDSGATWIKFISISSKTLDYQVVAEGWASESEDEDGAGKGAEDEGLGHTEFADTVRKIILAARWNHCHHLHLILPGLHEGRSELVDRMLRYVRHKIGGDDITVEVSCAGSPFLTDAAPPLETAVTALIQDRDPLVGTDCGRLTETVNLDPSALVALITDLHHGPIPLQPESQQRIIARSVLDHETDNQELVSRQDILTSVLYPALRGRKLVCTAFAASYFHKLIDAISTHSEERPPPPMALPIARDLSPLNRSVYCYGWLHRLSTITGHRGIERQVRLSLARHWTRGEDRDEIPLDVWHRHLGGYLIHRDKPNNWREMLGEGEKVPPEVRRWTNPWTTWGGD